MHYCSESCLYLTCSVIHSSSLRVVAVFVIVFIFANFDATADTFHLKRRNNHLNPPITSFVMTCQEHDNHKCSFLIISQHIMKGLHYHFRPEAFSSLIPARRTSRSAALWILGLGAVLGPALVAYLTRGHGFSGRGRPLGRLSHHPRRTRRDDAHYLVAKPMQDHVESEFV